MKVLGIETATSVCGAAVVDDGRVLAETAVDAPHVHAEKLIVLIDQCLRSAGCSIEAIKGIAVSIGPGSFTGLRIGLSVAKGLAYAHEPLFIAVPTLEALAWRSVYGGIVCNGDAVVSMIDARRDEVYTAVYYFCDGELREMTAAQARSLKQCETLDSGNNRVLLLGDGAEKFQQHLERVERFNVEHYIIPPRQQRVCGAAAVALLGERKLARGERSDAASIEPLYVKDFYTLVKTQHPPVIS